MDLWGNFNKGRLNASPDKLAFQCADKMIK
jgi:hypothetical protein